MAPKKQSKKDKASASSSKPKKRNPGMDGQEQKTATKASSGKKKAWGKDRGKNKDNEDDDDARGARRTLKPVRIKLNREGRDAILDILHQLHVAGADDGAEDDNDDSEEEDDEEEAEEQGQDSNSASEAESEKGSDPVEVDNSDGDSDFSDRRGQDGFEYDGSFGDMANLMSGLVVNETTLPTDGSDEAVLSIPGGNTTASKASKGSGETRGRSACDQGSGDDSSKSPMVAPGMKRPQGQVKNPLLSGSGTGSGKGSLRSNVTREKLLASMVHEDRKVSREEHRGKGMVPSAAIAAASTKGGGPVGGVDRGYQRPDPPDAGKGNEKVRLEVCGANKKTGAPDLNGKKVRVC